MKKIQVSDGTFAIVDDEDYHYLSRFYWSVHEHKTKSIVRLFTIGNRLVVIPMWKFIIPSENNKEILYLNRDTSDHRKENMRVVPIYVANHHAAKKGRGVDGAPSSPYKGVSYSSKYPGHKKWIADITCNGQRANKHFHTEKEAAEFYNEKAREFYGEHAYQNIIK